MALIETLYREVDGLSLLSEALNFDFSTKGMDEAFSDEELEGMSGMQAMRDRVMRVIGRNPTVRDFLEVTRRGRPREAIVGGPKEVADRFEKWFVERACDGYVVGGTHTPGTFEDFVRFVVPELQRRGIFQKDYKGATLRENLGLPMPRLGWWKAARVVRKERAAFRALNPFEHRRDPLAAADAHRHQRIASADAFQFVERLHRQDRARRADRMAERNA